LTPLDYLSAILTNIRNHITKAEGEDDDCDNPQRVEGEADKPTQQGNGEDHDHRSARDPAFDEQ
jgi:hypothetical protein